MDLLCCRPNIELVNIIMARLERDIQYALIGIISGLKHAMRHTMQAHGIPLSPLYFLIMKLIHDTPDCTSMLIAERSGRDKGQVTRLIKELEQLQFIAKRPNPDDKRSFFLQLSSAGLECFKLLESADMQALEIMTNNISDQELLAFLETALQMSHNLEQLDRAS